MAVIPDFVRGSRLFFILVFAVCAGSLTMALVGQYVFKLDPCVLCLSERVPFAVGGLVALAMAGLPTSPPLRRLALLLLLLAFAGNALLSGYHVGVEQHWWDSPACGGEAPTEVSLQDLMASANEAVLPPCDQPQWSLFGVTLAGYNMLLNLGLAALVAVALRRENRRARP